MELVTGVFGDERLPGKVGVRPASLVSSIAPVWEGWGQRALPFAGLSLLGTVMSYLHTCRSTLKCSLWSQGSVDGPDGDVRAIIVWYLSHHLLPGLTQRI